MVGGRCQYEDRYHNLFSLLCISGAAKGDIHGAMRSTEGSITFKCCCGEFCEELRSPYLEFLRIFADCDD